MRIAVSFPGCHRRGGVERVVLETVNHLAHRGHEVHLFANDWQEDAVDPRVARHHVPISRRAPLARVRQFPRRCEHEMLAVGSFDAHGAFGVMSPPGGMIWVGSVHAAWLEICRTQRDLAGRLRQYLNPYHHLILGLERRIFGGRHYRKLIALTEQVKQDLMRHYAVPDDDIVILPNGVSEAEFNPQRREVDRGLVRREFGIPDDSRVIIFVANETERKGFGPLVRAMARLQEADLHLLAVGKLDRRPYEAELAALGLTSRVHFTGPTSDAGRYFAAADVFALPTQYEAWGLVIVEALASGLPVLTSRLAGAAIAVREGETGELLDDPRDVGEIGTKLGSLLNGNGNGGSAEACSDSVRKYHWSNVLVEYESLLCGR